MFPLCAVLQHYPLYRVSDAGCTGQDAAPPAERHLLFREKYDVLSKEASQRVSTLQSHHTASAANSLSLSLSFLWSAFIQLIYSLLSETPYRNGRRRRWWWWNWWCKRAATGLWGFNVVLSLLSCCSGLSPASSWVDTPTADVRFSMTTSTQKSACRLSAGGTGTTPASSWWV